MIRPPAADVGCPIRQIAQKIRTTTKLPRAAIGGNLPRRRSVLAVALLHALLLPTAWAQGTSTGDADADAKRDLDTVFVTGSRIKRLDGETALPIEIITSCSPSWPARRPRPPIA